MSNVTWTQRLCLETRALLDKLTKWDRLVTSRDKGYLTAGEDIIGCVTGCISVALEMDEKGVPVWLFVVRPGSRTIEKNIIPLSNLLKQALLSRGGPELRSSTKIRSPRRLILASTTGNPVK